MQMPTQNMAPRTIEPSVSGASSRIDALPHFSQRNPADQIIDETGLDYVQHDEAGDDGDDWRGHFATRS